MPKRSQFLSMLGQAGWEELELVSKSGTTGATLRRRGASVDVEIFEGGQLLAKLVTEGMGARELVGRLSAVSGPYLDMFGPELAWTRSIEILFDMEASNVGFTRAGEPPIDGMLPSRKLDVFGKPKREDGSS
jgi:hypothetical protein